MYITTVVGIMKIETELTFGGIGESCSLARNRHSIIHHRSDIVATVAALPFNESVMNIQRNAISVAQLLLVKNAAPS